jgi:5-formyltetrahydrofolate cyclo-ligase
MNISMLHEPGHSKPLLRIFFKRIRRELDFSKISGAIEQQLVSHPHILTSNVILAYMALPGEVCLDPLFQALPQKCWGIPRCLPGNRLAWHLFSSELSWVIHPWGIREPHPDSPLLDPKQADLVLVPALACDYQGYRLGYGSGYYDRFLSDYPLPAWGIVPKACLSRIPLPQDPWDVPLQAVVTEDEILMINE